VEAVFAAPPPPLPWIAVAARMVVLRPGHLAVERAAGRSSAPSKPQSPPTNGSRYRMLCAGDTGARGGSERR
jgi:hypothetical protein